MNSFDDIFNFMDDEDLDEEESLVDLLDPDPKRHFIPVSYIYDVLFQIGEHAGRLMDVQLPEKAQKVKERYSGKKNLKVKSNWRPLFPRNSIYKEVVEELQEQMENIMEEPAPEILRLIKMMRVFCCRTQMVKHSFKWLIYALGQYNPGFFALAQPWIINEFTRQMEDDVDQLNAAAFETTVLSLILDGFNMCTDPIHEPPLVVDYLDFDLDEDEEDQDKGFGSPLEALDELRNLTAVFGLVIMVSETGLRDYRIISSFDLEEETIAKIEGLTEEMMDCEYIRNYAGDGPLAYSMAVFLDQDNEDALILEADNDCGSPLLEENSAAIFNLLKDQPYDPIDVKEELIKEAVIANLILLKSELSSDSGSDVHYQSHNLLN